jgi:hypothetical protein
VEVRPVIYVRNSVLEGNEGGTGRGREGKDVHSLDGLAAGIDMAVGFAN